MADQPLAVIDIGSNSGRMIVVRSPTGRHIETLLEAKSTLRLASDVAANGSLAPGAFERTLACLDDFLAQARAAGAARVVAVATAAVREATNGAALVKRVRTRTGIELEIVDGEREATLAFLGAVHSVPVENGMLLDVGGGSIEISRFREREMERAWTLPLGALLVSDRFFVEDPPARSERRRLIAHVNAGLAEAGVPALTEGERLVGTGGTIRNLARMDRRERSYPIARLHGYMLSLPRLVDLAGLLSSRPLKKRSTLSGLNPERADSIVAGALVVRTIMESLGAEEMTVSGKGLREGIAMETLANAMPSPATVREASLAALAARFMTWDPERARRRAVLASEIFHAASPGNDPDVAEMLEHAAVVLDAGGALDPYNRHEHAAATVLMGDLSGFSHAQLALLAAILRRADKESAGLKPYRSLLRVYDPYQVTRAALALAVADEIDLRLPAGASASIEASEASITVIGTVRPGRWSERLNGRTTTVFGRKLNIKTQEDEP